MNFLIAGLLVAAVQETAENPEYRSWSPFKAGTSVKLKEVAESGTITETLLTLIEVDEKKAVVEARVVRFSRGMKAEMPVERREITALVPKEDLQPQGQLLDTGEEEIQVAGRRILCRWTEVREAANVIVRTWTNSEVPGGIVRREIRTEGPTPSVIRLELVEWTMPS